MKRWGGSSIHPSSSLGAFLPSFPSPLDISHPAAWLRAPFTAAWCWQAGHISGFCHIWGRAGRDRRTLRLWAGGGGFPRGLAAPCVLRAGVSRQPAPACSDPCTILLTGLDVPGHLGVPAQALRPLLHPLRQGVSAGSCLARRCPARGARSVGSCSWSRSQPHRPSAATRPWGAWPTPPRTRRCATPTPGAVRVTGPLTSWKTRRRSARPGSESPWAVLGGAALRLPPAGSPSGVPAGTALRQRTECQL